MRTIEFKQIVEHHDQSLCDERKGKIHVHDVISDFPHKIHTTTPVI